MTENRNPEGYDGALDENFDGREEVSTQEVTDEQVQVRENEEPVTDKVSETETEPVQEEPIDLDQIDGQPLTQEAFAELDDNYLKSDPQVVGYRSLEEQEVMYDFIASNFDCTQESILDIGCGRGDFLRHVQELYQADIKYHGIDMNKILIQTAKEMSPGATFTASNLFKLDGNFAADWVINIGGLSIMYEPVKEDFDIMDALKNTVTKMMELADTGIVISLLSMNTSEDYDESYLVYDPVEVLDWALNEYGQLGGNVRLDHSVADSIFTLTIFK